MIPILMYHQIGQPAPRGTPYRGLTVHPRDFRRQMRWMHRLGYRGLAMHQLMPYLQGQQHGKVFGITFDDGYQNVLDHAVPILNDCGFHATNYFVVRQLGGTNAWDHPEGVPAARLMDVGAMREWMAEGHEVGSHTLNHPVLTRLSADKAANEILESKNALENLIGEPVTAFCYPYGKWSDGLRDIVSAAGYVSATTTQRGLARPADHPLALPRVPIMRSTHLIRFLQKCLTSLEDRKRG